MKRLKKVVKSKISDVVLMALKEKQTNHSKIKDIQYNHLKTQEYMTSRHMTNSMVETMTALRSSMVRGVRANFVPSSERTQCPLQCRDTAEDTQRHLLECPAILVRLTTAKDQVLESVTYDDIFGLFEDQVRAISIPDGTEDLPVGI